MAWSRAGILAFILLLPIGLFACKAGQQATTPNTSPTQLAVELYKSPTCGCCGQYVEYLQANDLNVQVTEVADTNALKTELGIPQELWSCHTMKVGKYFVEGHVPLEAIERLLETQPDIEGIALPGMPAGSPGMGGTKTEPFIIYALANGVVNEFMRL